MSAEEQKIIYANLYLNTIIDGDSQTSSSPDFSWGNGEVCTQATIDVL